MGKNRKRRGDDVSIDSPCKIVKKIEKFNCSSSVPQSNLFFNIGKRATDSSLFSNCIIKTQGTEIKVHKYILAIRSSVFHDNLNTISEGTPTTIIEIEDFSVDVVNEMLKYIYTDKVSSIENMASEVLAIADKYKLYGLKAIAEEALCCSLDIGNVWEFLALSEKYLTDTLKERCQELILRNIEYLTKTEKWRKIVLESPVMLEGLLLKQRSINSTDVTSGEEEEE
uniref:BTB domain-containing protein n=1 Tax=Strongyloides papillosus TaxID=174720 RepID=A0A0N5BAF8_STREA